MLRACVVCSGSGETPARAACPHCDGHGVQEVRRRACLLCEGSGCRADPRTRTIAGNVAATTRAACPRCGGAGFLEEVGPLPHGDLATAGCDEVAAAIGLVTAGRGAWVPLDLRMFAFRLIALDAEAAAHTCLDPGEQLAAALAQGGRLILGHVGVWRIDPDGKGCLVFPAVKVPAV
jgi:hypothetical protein